MNIEIECKLHLPDPAAVSAKLELLGATDLGKVYEQNWVFDKDSELRNSESLLRLRRHDDAEYGILTHKTKIRQKEGKFKSRREIETRVEDAGKMQLIIESLGYAVSWYYEKHRHTFKLDNMVIVLDKTPELGVFIEIEAETEDMIEELLNRLDLDIKDNIMMSYPAIWSEHCSKTGRDFCDWRF